MSPAKLKQMSVGTFALMPRSSHIAIRSSVCCGVTGESLALSRCGVLAPKRGLRLFRRTSPAALQQTLAHGTGDGSPHSGDVGHATFGEEIFDISEAETESMVRSDRIADDLWRKPVTTVPGFAAIHLVRMTEGLQRDKAAERAQLFPRASSASISLLKDSKDSAPRSNLIARMALPSSLASPSTKSAWL